MLTWAFFATPRAHSTAVLSPGIGISAVRSFAISSALIDVSRSSGIPDENFGDESECKRKAS